MLFDITVFVYCVMILTLTLADLNLPISTKQQCTSILSLYVSSL